MGGATIPIKDVSKRGEHPKLPKPKTKTVNSEALSQAHLRNKSRAAPKISRLWGLGFRAGRV